MIKKHDISVMLLIMLVLSSSFLMIVPLEANDELWNFSNVYKMINGFELYEDLNVIVTPLFFLLGKIVLELLGANYLSFRIYSIIILNTCLFLVIYQIFKILKMPKIDAIFFTIFFMIVQMFLLLNGFYNYLAILFVLLGILCELKVNHHKKYKELIQGVIIFAIFLSKQNITVLYIIGRILYFLIKEGKKQWKKIALELLTSAVCLGLFLGYMYIQNKLLPFLDYTMGGLKEFSQNNTFGLLTGLVTILGEIAVSIFMMLMAKNKKIPFKSEERNHILLLASISLCMLGISYPIFNTAHVFMGSICFIVMVIYILDLLIFTPLLYNKKMNQVKKWLLVIRYFHFSWWHNRI